MTTFLVDVQDVTGKKWTGEVRSEPVMVGNELRLALVDGTYLTFVRENVVYWAWKRKSVVGGTQ